MLPVTEGRILGHLPLVQHVVERICMSIPKHIDRGDLFQVGVIGLIEALTRFDETLNCKFSTYAVLRIRGQILDELRDRDWVPRGARDRSERYQGVKEELTHALGRAPLEE